MEITAPSVTCKIVEHGSPPRIVDPGVKVPAGHCSQQVLGSDPSIVEELLTSAVPIGQATSIARSTFPEQVEVAADQQVSSDVDPTEDVCPAGHGVHASAPFEELYVPAGHNWHGST